MAGTAARGAAANGDPRPVVRIDYRNSGVKTLRGFAVFSGFVGALLVLGAVVTLFWSTEEALMLCIYGFAVIGVSGICYGFSTIVESHLMKAAVMRTKYDFVVSKDRPEAKKE